MLTTCAACSKIASPIVIAREPIVRWNKRLQGMETNDPKAVAELLPLVYEELRKVAIARMAKEKAGHTLQPPRMSMRLG
jgi:hypothetical protein